MKYCFIVTLTVVMTFLFSGSVFAAVGSEDMATVGMKRGEDIFRHDREEDRRNFTSAITVLRETMETRNGEVRILAENDTLQSAAEAEVHIEDAESVADGTTTNTPYRKQPMQTGAKRAPRPGLKPSPNPLEGMNRRAIRDAVMRPVEFGESGLGFKAPDWTEPLRDLEADTMVADLKTGETVLHSNVRLRLGEMLFNSDEFRYAEKAGSYKASGNVFVRQDNSQLRASSLEYFAPELEMVESTFILEPSPTEAVFARRRLSMGRLLAERLEVMEPTRTLYADYVDYDFSTQTGELRNAHGMAAVFFYNAEHVQLLGEDNAIIKNAWFTTCPREVPHYRIHVDEMIIRKGEVVSAKKTRLQLGNYKTPIYMPLWKGGKDQPWSLDFDSGRRADLGYFANVGMLFEVTPEVSVGPRIMPTSKQGIGAGSDLYYDFYNKPSSRLYRTKGDAHLLYTTKERGYGLWRHRYDLNKDLALRMEVEQWSDRDFYKDFFYDDYKNRTTPRT
ncbi:MAG: LPS-assembly protein LptD, partial [Candidatus Hydrogenedentes bacterium]|nr:LPS-assembly protein LptD [Candidatus Hydrogenedentota bacterium]